jgi:hypothetical protein
MSSLRIAEFHTTDPDNDNREVTIALDWEKHIGTTSEQGYQIVRETPITGKPGIVSAEVRAVFPITKHAQALNYAVAMFRAHDKIERARHAEFMARLRALGGVAFVPKEA